MHHQVSMKLSWLPPHIAAVMQHPPENSALPPTGRPPARAPFDDSAASEGSALAPRILVVEDDFLISMQTENALAEAGFEVVLASSGEQALAMAAAYDPVLAVMDIRLAGNMDGVDAALELFRTHGLRSIFATAHSDPEVHARAAGAEPAGWLVKPYSMPSLVAAVRGALADRKP